jgi:hypothetical protein
MIKLDDKLDDEQLAAVMSAARRLPVDLRDPLLHAVARALSSRAVVGPGTVHQVVREVQRQYLVPPKRA